jgi:peroxiredoxin
MAYQIIQKIVPNVSMLKRLSIHHVVVLSMLLITSVTLNAILAVRMNDLASTLNRLTTKPVKRNVLKPGMNVRAFTAKSINGQELHFSYDESQKPTVLYFLSTSCPWCTYNIMNVRKLSESVSDKYRVGIVSILSLPATPSASDLQNYRSQIAKYDNLNLAVYDAPTQVKDDYSLVEVPATVVVSPKGEVLKVWFGPYRAEVRKEIEDYFSITLPGITEIR